VPPDYFSEIGQRCGNSLRNTHNILHPSLECRSSPSTPRFPAWAPLGQSAE
jgi:hypothetical protein